MLELGHNKIYLFDKIRQNATLDYDIFGLA